MYPQLGLQIQIRVVTGVRVYALGLVWPLAFPLICLSQVQNVIAFFFILVPWNSRGREPTAIVEVIRWHRCWEVDIYLCVVLGII